MSRKPTPPAVVRIEGEIGYIPLRNGGEALIDACDAEFAGRWSWKWRENTTSKAIYVVRNRFVSEGLGRGMIYLHRALTDAPADRVVDHWDGNGLDNRRSCNLRVCTNQQNLWNARLNTTGTKSGLKGAFPYKRRFRSEICVSGKTIRLGSFPTAEEAHAAYMAAAREHFGEFARAG